MQRTVLASAIAGAYAGGPAGADPQRLMRRLQQMHTLRGKHENVWKDCFDHSFPIRGAGLRGQMLDAQQAADIKSRIVDSTATDGGRILASALQSGMTPASARWFGLEVEGVSDAAERWLDDAAGTLHQHIHNANFDAVGFECQLDMVGAGWFAMFVDENRDEGGFLFDAWPIAQVYAAASKAGGAVDTVFRDYTLPAEAVVDEFGADNVSEQTRKLAIDSPDEPVQLLHAIYPRRMFVVGSQQGRTMQFASCHVEQRTQKLVKESGYPELPVIVPRWAVIPQTPYATGPMLDVLPDVRELNELKRLDKAAADIAVAGMWIAEDDGVLNPRTIKVGARKVVVANSVDSMKALETGSNFQLASDRIAGLQAAIRKLLMADQLQPQDGPAMTATEVHARVALLRQQLGPLFGRMQAEYLQGLIKRTFMVAFRAGALGAPPPELADRTFSIKYISPLARAQKLEDVSAIDQLNAGIVELAAVPQLASVLDVIDFDEQQRIKAQALGVPLKTIRDADQVAQIRQERIDAQQKAAADAQQQAVQQQALQSHLNIAEKQAA